MSAAGEWRDLWSVEKLGSKVRASLAPDGEKISIGITNMLSRTGGAHRVSLAQARELAVAIFAVTGGAPQ